MAIIYRQTDTLAPCGVIQACSPVAPAADADAIQATVGGTAGVTELACSVGASAMEGCFEAELAIQDTDSLDAGDLTMRINITTAQMDLTWEEVYVCRLNSACASQETLGSATGLAIDIAAGGVFSTTVSLSAASAHNAGDVVYILCVFKNAFTMSSRSLAITPDQNIDTPFTAAAGGPQTVNLSVVTLPEKATVTTLSATRSVSLSTGALPLKAVALTLATAVTVSLGTVSLPIAPQAATTSLARTVSLEAVALPLAVPAADATTPQIVTLSAAALPLAVPTPTVLVVTNLEAVTVPIRSVAAQVNVTVPLTAVALPLVAPPPLNVSVGFTIELEPITFAFEFGDRLLIWRRGYENGVYQPGTRHYKIVYTG